MKRILLLFILFAPAFWSIAEVAESVPYGFTVSNQGTVAAGKQGVRHMTVVFVDPGRLLRLSGGPVPLQDTGLSGTLSFQITPASSGFFIELKDSVDGFVSGGCEKLAPIVDSVLARQSGRLRNFINTGNPEGK